MHVSITTERGIRESDLCKSYSFSLHQDAHTLSSIQHREKPEEEEEIENEYLTEYALDEMDIGSASALSSIYEEGMKCSYLSCSVWAGKEAVTLLSLSISPSQRETWTGEQARSSVMAEQRQYFFASDPVLTHSQQALLLCEFKFRLFFFLDGEETTVTK